MKRRRVSNKISNVWRYFVENNGQVKCSLCNHEMVFSGPTSNMRDHLRSKHCTDVDSENVNPRMSKEQIDDTLVEFIISSFSSFRLVENEHFKNFVHFLQNSQQYYNVLSRQTISNKIHEKSAVLKEKIRTKLVQPQFISLTVDLWTSDNKQHFIGVTTHFINENFQLESYGLHFEEINNYFITSTLNMLKMIPDILNSFNVINKIISITTDEGCDIISCLKETKNNINNGHFIHIICFAHKLSTTIRNVLKNEGIITKLQNIAKHFSKSYKSTQMLLSEQHQKEIINFVDELLLTEEDLEYLSRKFSNMNINEGDEGVTDSNIVGIGSKRMIKMSRTRWRGMYDVIKRYLILKESIPSILNKQKRSDLVLLEHEECILLDIYNILEVLIPLFDIAEYESQSTIVIIPYYIHGCINVLKEMISKTEKGNEIRKKIYCSLEERLTSFPAEIKVGMFFHPLLKSEIGVIFNGTEYNNILQNLRSEYNILRSLNRVRSTRKISAEDVVWSKLIHRSLLPNSSTLDNELEEYIGESFPFPLIYNHKTFNLLEWWEKSQIRFPILSELSKKYLTFIPSSSAIERKWSIGGDVLTKKRNRMCGKILSDLIFIKANDSNIH